MNTLRTLLEEYLAMRRALGFKLRTEGTGLTTFVSYAEAAGIDHITNAAAPSRRATCTRRGATGSIGMSSWKLVGESVETLQN